ncbi:rap1 GTPase-GDP dissociation stimulator 1-like [Tubulanus polymorphus]|uniref:rap1 GTPase-GDP dissociation stimulator 1-like n=1 Tax=Tubulanus polymorphus TaxID=672921 RepID=UPI003DA66830
MGTDDDVMIDSLRKLKLADSGKDKEVAEKSLNHFIQVLTADGCDRSVVGKNLIGHGLLSEIRLLVESDVCVEKSAQTVAELAKSATVREECVNEGLVPLFVDYFPHEDLGICTQVCRALGNICYDNDVGRDAVDCCDGVEKLLQLLRKYYTEETNETLTKLRMMGCGCLLNLTNTNESLQEKALELDSLQILDEYIQRYGDDEDLCSMILLALSSLVDSDVGKLTAKSSNIPMSVVSLWQTRINSELDDAVLEFLANLAENDDIKVQLAQSELMNKLLNCINKNRDEKDDDAQQVVRLAADLVILLLTGDKSMEILYDNGKGLIFEETKKWLSCSHDHLKMSGALAMGNFARSDVHCIQLVKDGITEELLNLLKSIEGDAKSNVTLQHGALSALRNLSIPPVNKPVMVKSGALAHVLKLVDCDMTPVQFKLLGFIRMTIDGQEVAANHVGANENFLKHLVSWCKVESHAGVKGEANRLLAWLIKNSKSTEVMSLILKHGGLPHLVAMTSSEHQVMLNEALLALTLLSSCVLGSMANDMKELELIPSLMSLLSLEAYPSEIVFNTLMLVRLLLHSEVLTQVFMDVGLVESLQLLSQCEDSKVQAKVHEVLAITGPH